MNAKHHLLIVDENPYVVDILVQTLTKDFKITVASTGQEAARLLIQGNRFDCVLTELDLAFFNGLELTKLIRMSRLASQTPVVILSNVPDSATRIQCLEQGVDAFLSKPFNPLEVKAKLHALLRRADSPIEEPQRRLVPAPVQSDAKPFWQQKSRILSMLFGSYALPQSA
ncbi:response regulator [Spirosoma sp. KCTC 42546]|uniref:response regulator transcription factor n=1 Tax=Spirosoma sp. KCTC 42546 TaxID=2520506 RepID=UPI00115A5578|nr:response regulator [Spirosoma sp. KCTC 42546]QDK79715.1 response regulator [Spirosoma sp. KCTC 42546]